MDQFRQVGEVLGSLKALMVMKHEISINPRQCCLLFDMLELAFDTISIEIRQSLRLEEKHTKWKALEHPMKELHRVFREAELHIRQCMDVKDWWGRVICLHMTNDCVELHIHNLLACFPVVIEAIETAAEISGDDEEDMQKRRVALIQKYDQDWDDPKLFLWKFGKQYIVPKDICERLETVWKEDRWLLLEKMREKRTQAKTNSLKHEKKLAEILIKKLNYGHLKEIRWHGESFALRKFYGEIEPLRPEISSLLSMSHPNVLQYHCAFYDEDKREGFLVMELMSKDLGAYIKDNYGRRNKIPFSIPVAVEIMLQIARGMEYLHSKRIYHGDLNPSNVLLRPNNAASIGSFHAKVTGFGMTTIKRSPQQAGTDLDIWLAPEVLAELEQPDKKSTAKYTEKGDVYSFGMLCFELLTGKVPFEDSHLQGEKMVRNIRAGGRPLFSNAAPKYLANLTRKCWQMDPSLRPSFSSLCRILRYIRKILVINPDHGHPDCPPPLVDYCDMETGYLKKFSNEASGGGLMAPISHIPFQLFAYRIVEKEKISGKKWENPVFGDEQLTAIDDLFMEASDRRSVCSEIIGSKHSSIAVDMRSVISEIPQRKFFQFDRKSFGSESPGKRFSAPPGKMLLADTPERNGSSSPAIMVSRLVENGKSPLSRVMEKKLGNKEDPQRISPSSSGEITEKQMLQLEELSLDISDETDGSGKSIKKPANFESTVVKPMLAKKVGNSRTRRVSDAPTKSSAAKKPSLNASSRSPGRITKKPAVPRFPAASKTCVASKTVSPISSPARAIKKNVASFSPTSSPSRHWLSACQKECASPASSPMHPCRRCSRLRKDSDAMRPQRTKTDRI